MWKKVDLCVARYKEDFIFPPFPLLLFQGIVGFISWICSRRMWHKILQLQKEFRERWKTATGAVTSSHRREEGAEMSLTFRCSSSKVNPIYPTHRIENPKLSYLHSLLLWCILYVSTLRRDCVLLYWSPLTAKATALNSCEADYTVRWISLQTLHSLGSFSNTRYMNKLEYQNHSSFTS